MRRSLPSLSRTMFFRSIVCAFLNFGRGAISGKVDRIALYCIVLFTGVSKNSVEAQHAMEATD